MEELERYITVWKELVWKGFCGMTFCKRQRCRRSNNVSGCWGWGWDEQVAHRGLLGQWKYCVWYNTDGGYKSHICPNPQNIRCEERILREILWLWPMMRHLGSSLLYKKGWVMLIIEKATHVWGQDICGKSLYTPLNFVVNLKLLWKISLFKNEKNPKQTRRMGWV